ncbi:osmotically inducible protein OsmC [Asanoa hainanensis]|uniref:Osmotically inducible protein OsmC n=1 Tax=Asanoa hainanensis TaxID=560556 RepID=A0A239GQQ7_9ACTN|nr:OsmC family protein [Asanoa hainanensis]SNS71152.1 osmotically inducible protein OsmC [Asanoa hainanensis]
MSTRSVHAKLVDGYQVDVTAGAYSLRVDEPETVAGGTGTGPQPTDYLLTAAASCFAMAIAYSARKRGLALPPLEVNATGTYDGPAFAEIALEVVVDLPDAEIERLIAAGERVCYVTNTLRRGPSVTIHHSSPVA